MRLIIVFTAIAIGTPILGTQDSNQMDLWHYRISGQAVAAFRLKNRIDPSSKRHQETNTLEKTYNTDPLFHQWMADSSLSLKKKSQKAK